MSGRRTAFIPLAAALVAGIALRLIHLAGGRSLYIDEARLALNIGSRTLAGLLRPLDYEQTAPIPFLFAEKLAVMVGGMNEVALRFVPFLAGIAVLFVIHRLAARLLPASAAALVVALAAVSPALIQYSNEAKPYSIDALFGALLTLLGIELLASPHDPARWRKYAVAGTAAVLVSTPGILVACGMTAVLLASREVRGHAWLRTRLIGISMLWVALFGVLYVAFYRAVSQLPYMQSFWQPAFLTQGEGALVTRAGRMAGDVLWGTFMGGPYFHTATRETFPLVILMAAGLAAVALAGAIFVVRRAGWIMLAVLVSPTAAAIGAAAAGVYPITLRLVQFCLPALIVLVVGGAALAAQNAPPRRQQVLLAVMAAALLVRPTLRVTLPAFHSYQWQELRPLVRHYESAGHDEPVYVFANAVPAWLFYTTDWKHPDRARLAWYTRMASVGGPAFENAPPRPHPVVGEGEDLAYQAGRRREIVGISTGDQWRVLVGSRNGRPDDGWAENEARRIAAAAAPGIWLLFSHYRGSENHLFDQIEADGLVQDLGEPAKGAHLFHYTRPTTPTR